MIKQSYEMELERNGICLSTTSGWSMFPLLRDRRDTIVLAPVKGELKKYDLPLYKRPDGTYVLHRILEVRPEGFVLCGDHQLFMEFPVKRDWIVGVVTGIYRDEHFIDVKKSRGYRMYVLVWCSSMKARSIFLKIMSVWNRFRRIFHSENTTRQKPEEK